VTVNNVTVNVPLDPYLSLRALAGYSGLSVRKLRQLLELPPAEALPCYRVGGKILVRRSAFDAWIAQYASRGRPSLAKALSELGIPA
jgi:excisionase family DNA binding protein